MISVILPTYNEAENVRRIIPAITKVFQEKSIEGEVIVVDDNSPDGTAGIASSLADSYPVRVHVRKSDRGLSRAVIEGFSLAKGEICVVMDADLSHPVEKIPDMVQPILEGRCDATVGSRYVRGGDLTTGLCSEKSSAKGPGFLPKGSPRSQIPRAGSWLCAGASWIGRRSIHWDGRSFSKWS